MMKRSAFGVCRCVGAISFGRIACTPANSAGVMNVVPGSAGFSSMSTRRSASLAVISSQARISRSEEHTSELQSQSNLVCRLLLEKKKKTHNELCNSVAKQNIAHPMINLELTL